VVVQVITVVVLLSAVVYGLAHMGFTPAVLNNVAFALGHVLVVQGFIRYALWPQQPRDADVDATDEADAAAAGAQLANETEPLA